MSRLARMIFLCAMTIFSALLVNAYADDTQTVVTTQTQPAATATGAGTVVTTQTQPSTTATGAATVVTTQTQPTTTVNGTPAQQTTITTTKAGPNGTTNVVERHTIVTTEPTAKENLAIPAGCTLYKVIPGAWEGDIWIPSHNSFKCANVQSGEAWIEGYWSCNKYTDAGICTNWEWQKGHYVKTIETVD